VEIFGKEILSEMLLNGTACLARVEKRPESQFNLPRRTASEAAITKSINRLAQKIRSD